jgi:signal transduction histidine kinase
MDEVERELTNCLAALAGFVRLVRRAGGELTEAQQAYLAKAEDAAQRALRVMERNCTEPGLEAT